jgi:CheY-like chemotaxis protein
LAGFRTIAATTSQEALALARRHKLDLMTSDINLCGINGLEFLTAFKHSYPTAPVII